MQVSIACQYEDERWKSTSKISISQVGISDSQFLLENNRKTEGFVRRSSFYAKQ